MKTVAVVGATGRQGLAQIRQLTAHGYKVRALSRNANPYLGDHHIDVKPFYFDLYDPATYAAALEGCDALFYTHPLQSPVAREELVPQVATAAKQAGLLRFVWNTSTWIPDKPGDPFVYGNNTAAINGLFRTGIGATVFGAVIFMDNLLTDWARPFIVRQKRYVYPHNPKLGANWISLDDVAKIMIASLSRPDFEGSWLNIGGPERILPAQVAQMLSEHFGEEIKYDPCTPEEFGELLVSAMPDSVPDSQRKAAKQYMKAFYEYNNDAPTKPFQVNVDHMCERLPEMKFEKMTDWIARQDWSDSAHRPSGG